MRLVDSSAIVESRITPIDNIDSDISDDHIGIFKNAIPRDLCEQIIEQIKYINSEGYFETRLKLENVNNGVKADKAYMPTDSFFIDTGTGFVDNVPITGYMYGALKNCFYLYSVKYSGLGALEPYVPGLKIQITAPGEGYHIWHSEQGPGEASSRCAVFMIYLNDIDEGGETEFLYQRRRIKAEAGTVVIWPAGYTHQHRGNSVISDQEKYVGTGWFKITFKD